MRHGVPRSMYSDKDSVFRAVKDGSPTQFAPMMRELCVSMIFFSSPQAKGRVERYNSTAQMRLPTDLVRFGPKDYDELNGWFDEFYTPYLNSKFSYRPADPRSDLPVPEGLDLSKVFRTTETRLSRGCLISYRGLPCIWSSLFFDDVHDFFWVSPRTFFWCWHACALATCPRCPASGIPPIYGWALRTPRVSRGAPPCPRWRRPACHRRRPCPTWRTRRWS